MAVNEEKKLVEPADANAAYMNYLKQQQANAAAASPTAAQQPAGAQASFAGIKPFKYDFNGDALYEQASQRAQQLGRQAMMDTMGQAATMTGGYGNTYAQNAGQQAYNSYLQGLNDQLPQFQQMAMNKYQMDYAQYQDNQKLAQAQVDYLLSIGVEPDAELMAMAGYSDQYKNSVLSRANAGGVGSYVAPKGNLSDVFKEANTLAGEYGVNQIMKAAKESGMSDKDVQKATQESGVRVNGNYQRYLNQLMKK